LTANIRAKPCEQGLLEQRLNILGQYLQADGNLGYVVVETDTDQNCDAVLSELRSLDGTIGARLIRRV
jgi:D-3-phosphoglycerate dehydrogenase / 2-oxoglutarate reductase